MQLKIFDDINSFAKDVISIQKEDKVYSVTEISIGIKKALDSSFSLIKVRGEISGLKIASSGHAYFNLKDDSSVIACTCWKNTLMLFKSSLSEGMEICIHGRINIYQGQSKYQINVEKIEQIGSGALMQLFIKRKETFEKEGLFDQSRKKQLPKFPKVIGIITSETGSVIKDMIHRIKERFPTKILLWPVSVQGDSSAREVSAAIDGFNKIQNKEGFKVDVIIVARGGGSIEDLWSFNEENVVRSAFNSSIPIVSAIGHETDFTLLDFVADSRAPTPTAAAEFCTPVLHEIRYKLEDFQQNFTKKIKTKISHLFQIIELFKSSSLYNYNSVFYKYDQRLDFSSIKLNSMGARILDKKRSELNRFRIENISPKNLISLCELRLSNLNLYRSFNDYYKNIQNKLENFDLKVQSIDLNKTLKMGFAIIKNQNKVLRSIKELDLNKKVSIIMHDGSKEVEIKLEEKE